MLGFPGYTRVHKDKQTHSIPGQPILGGVARSAVLNHMTLLVHRHCRSQQFEELKERGTLVVCDQVVGPCYMWAFLRQTPGRTLRACILKRTDASTSGLRIEIR